MRQLLSSLNLLLLSLSAQAAVSDINRIYHEVPSKEAFEVCSGGGCVEIQQISISAEDWQKVVNVFTEKTTNSGSEAEHERTQIAQAIGVLEAIVGAKNGTSTDRAGTFDNSSFPGQLDCNDEAINTTTYMRLMVQYGLVKLHAVEDMRTRNFFFTGWPHSTAVIHEIESKQRYAVDSWFYDNGFPATVVPFDVWKSGYIPTDSPIGHRRDVKQTHQ